LDEAFLDESLHFQLIMLMLTKEIRGVNPTKLFSTEIENCFRFALLSLSVCSVKNIVSNLKWPSLKEKK
jgi:hypothetical protein